MKSSKDQLNKSGKVSKTEDIACFFFLCPINLYKVLNVTIINMCIVFKLILQRFSSCLLFFITGGRPCLNAETVTQDPLCPTESSPWGICTVGIFPLYKHSIKCTATAIVSNHQIPSGHICLCKQGFSCRRAGITKIAEVLSVGLNGLGLIVNVFVLLPLIYISPCCRKDVWFCKLDPSVICRIMEDVLALSCSVGTLRHTFIVVSSLSYYISCASLFLSKCDM